MKKLHFEISIRASSEKVWHAVTDDKSYREWTEAFCPNSYYEGGWDKGDKILFIGEGANGEKGGMVSEIAESRKYSFISIRHRGYLNNGVEDTTSDAVKAWAPSYENYTLSRSGDATKFEVDIDIEEKYSEMFNETWPLALVKLKQIAER